MQKIYDKMISELGLNPEEVPLLAGETVRQEYDGCCWQHNAIIAKLPTVIPNSYPISSRNLPAQEDHCHFTTEAYRQFGQRFAGQMLLILEKLKLKKKAN